MIVPMGWGDAYPMFPRRCYEDRELTDLAGEPIVPAGA